MFLPTPVGGASIEWVKTCLLPDIIVKALNSDDCHRKVKFLLYVLFKQRREVFNPSFDTTPLDLIPPPHAIKLLIKPLTE